jgi:hypothetical protein
MTMRTNVTRKGTAIALRHDVQIIARRARNEAVAERQSAGIATRLNA